MINGMPLEDVVSWLIPIPQQRDKGNAATLVSGEQCAKNPMTKIFAGMDLTKITRTYQKHGSN